MGNSSGHLSRKEIEELQKITKFSREELKNWYNVFHKEYPNGKMNQAEFCAENMKAHGGDIKLWEHLFHVLDTDHSGYIDFKEFIVSMSVGTKGTPEDKLKWAFKIYDADGNGYIEYNEMLNLLQSIFKMVSSVQPDLEKSLPGDQNSPEKRCQRIYEKMDKDRDQRLSLDEFIAGCRSDPAIVQAMSLF